jgi:hypothetical protein
MRPRNGSEAAGAARNRAVGARLFGTSILLAALGTVAIQGVRRIDDPWGADMRSVNGGGYYGVFVKRFDALGPSGTLLANTAYVLPTTPQKRVVYFNHPQTYGWLQYAWSRVFGVSEAGIRSLALCIALAGVVACFFLLREFVGIVAAGAGAFVYAVVPICSFWGAMASHEPASAALLFVAYRAAAVAARRPSRARTFVAALWVVAAGALEWSGYLGVPVGALMIAGSDPAEAAAERRRRVALYLILSAALGAVALFAHVAHFAIVVGGFDAATAEMKAAAIGTEVFLDRASLVAPALRHAVALWTPYAAGLWCGGVAAGLVVGGRTRRLATLALAATIPGALYVALFLRHASVHPFWGIAAAPSLPFGVAAAFDFAGRLRSKVARRSAGVVFSAAAAAASIFGAARTHRQTEADRTPVFRDVGVLFEAHTTADDFILTNRPERQIAFYADRYFFFDLDSAAKFRAAIDELRGLGIRDDRVVFVRDPGSGGAELDSALAEFGETTRFGPVTKTRGRK